MDNGFNNPQNSNNGEFNNRQDNNSNFDNSNSYGYNQSSFNSNTDYSNQSDSNSQYSQYGGNVQYKWNYDDYQKALNDQKKAADRSKKRRGLKPFLVTVCSVVGVAIIGLAIVGISSLASYNKSFNTSSLSNAGSLVLNSQPSSPSKATASSGSELTVEQVAAKLTPSVVGVEIYSLQSIEPTAEGSGIVMTSDGYIITNAHVIEGYKKIRIVMSDNKTYDTVKVIGSDTKSDIAVLKVNAAGLTPAVFGDSNQLKVGQAVIAIGNPGGLALASTVTNGIISGLNRTVSSTSNMTYIQTNALINPGNSGGPLVNMYGQVIGINTSKITEVGYEGIGFAIPISTAKPIIDSIIKYGYVTGRVKVGISVYPLSNTQAKWYNYPSGLYVEKIEPTSDAYAKGLRAKDIITKINGISLASDDSDTVFNTFYKEESKHKVGDTINLEVYRTESGSTFQISVKLEEDKGDDGTAAGNDNGNQNGNGSENEDNYSNFWRNFFR